MNPNHLKQLAVVIKQGSISAAAEQLFITQPTLTRSLQQLEQKVGAPLLKRTRYGVIATEIGERLGQIGEKILQEAHYGDEVIRQWHSGFHNEFTIGLDPLWEYALNQETIQTLMGESKFVFHIRTGSVADQIELLKQGKLDFLIGPAHISVAQRGLQREVLFRDRSAVFAGATSRFKRKNKPLTAKDLDGQHWFIAGASAGFMNEQQELHTQKAAKITFTGSIHSVMHLLQTTHLLVHLPARLTLLCKQVHESQMLALEDDLSSRRDIALWNRIEESERPDMQKVRQILVEFMTNLDQTCPTFELDI